MSSGPSPSIRSDAEEVEELRETVEELRETVEGLEARTDALSTQLQAAKRLLIGDGHASDLDAMAEIREEHGPINAQLAEVSTSTDRETVEREVGLLRAEHGAKLRQIAEETGVDLDGAAEGDAIDRVRREGVDAVADPVYKKHRRAEVVLRNVEEWGEVGREREGRAVRLERPVVRRNLNSTLDADLSSGEVGRVFDAIESLAEGTTRFTRRETEHQVSVLYVGAPNTEALD